MTAEQVIPAAIVAVILILVIAGVVRAAGRRRGANEEAFGAGGVTKVPLGTTGVATDGTRALGRRLPRSGEQWTARSRTGVAIPIGGRVRVVDHDGLTLIVDSEPASVPATSRRPNGSPRGRHSPRVHPGLVALLLFFAAVKIVNQYERILVFTLGRTSPDEVKGPGWVLVVPIVQRGSGSTCASSSSRYRARRTSPRTTPRSASTS